MATEYIKREDALDAWYDNERFTDIEAIPAADVVERKLGYWIAVDPAYEYYKCSKCRKGTTFDTKPYNFCPNCGADMRGNDDV